MPETGKYEKIPRPESISKMISYLKGTEVVSRIERIDEQTFKIARKNKIELIVYLTNIYTVSIAEVHEILGLCPNCNAIITMSMWNSYSSEAKSYCISRRIGLYKFKEFLGAVYYEGEDFLHYVSPENRKKK